MSHFYLIDLSGQPSTDVPIADGLVWNPVLLLCVAPVVLSCKGCCLVEGLRPVEFVSTM